MGNKVWIISHGFVKHASIAGENVANFDLAKLEISKMKMRVLVSGLILMRIVKGFV